MRQSRAVRTENRSGTTTVSPVFSVKESVDFALEDLLQVDVEALRLAGGSRITRTREDRRAQNPALRPPSRPEAA